MGTSKETDGSLSHQFMRACSEQRELEQRSPRTSEFESTFHSALSSLQRCRELVDQLSIFSPNEEVEDLSTQNIQYLGIDYRLAELQLRSYGENRIAVLNNAAELLESFLKRLDQYSILGQSDRKLLERYQENRKSFSLVSTNNVEERRKVKIARFQEERALKSKLEHLRTQSIANHVDDEIIRDLYLTELKFFVNQAFQSLDMILQESAILSHMQRTAVPTEIPPSEDPRARASKHGYSERLDGPLTAPGLGKKGGPILSLSGKPLRPFTLTSRRAEMRDGVFRPGHNLPTMSIDEYLEEERRRGGIIEGGGNANVQEPEPDEDNMEAVDAATMKAREWDEFVEANPKGAGNRLNRG